MVDVVVGMDLFKLGLDEEREISEREDEEVLKRLNAEEEEEVEVVEEGVEAVVEEGVEVVVVVVLVEEKVDVGLEVVEGDEMGVA